jgi:hypothetical protein
LERHRIDDLDHASEAAHLGFKIGGAARAVARRLFVPHEDGVNLPTVDRVDHKMRRPSALRTRDGALVGTVPYRGLITVYVEPPTSATTEQQFRRNPLGIYVRDFSWSKQM